MDAMTLLKQHVSVRRFTSQDITTEQEHEIVETAQRSPTSSNLQTFSIISVRIQATKKIIAELSGNQKHVEQCPLFLVFVADLHRLHAITNKKGYGWQGDLAEYCIVATVDAALVAARALIAAQALGLGGVMVGAIRNHPTEVCNILSLPQDTYPVMGLSLGYPEIVPPIKPRLPLNGVWHKESYDDSKHHDAVRQYDETILAGGHLTGRHVEEDKYPDFAGAYSWTEHSARRMASTATMSCRPFMLEFLRSRGLMKR
jgi:nitroreductase